MIIYADSTVLYCYLNCFPNIQYRTVQNNSQQQKLYLGVRKYKSMTYHCQEKNMLSRLYHYYDNYDYILY